MITTNVREATLTPEGAVLTLEVAIPVDTPLHPGTIAEAVADTLTAVMTTPQRLPIHYCHPDTVRHLAPPQATD